MAFSEEVRALRLVTCNDCDQLLRPEWVCADCGCFIPEKVKNPSESCPMDKWGAVGVEEQPA